MNQNSMIIHTIRVRKDAYDIIFEILGWIYSNFHKKMSFSDCCNYLIGYALRTMRYEDFPKEFRQALRFYQINITGKMEVMQF